MKQGNIIFLNGTSSAGKTAIAKALQDVMEGYYIHTGIDHIHERAPARIHVFSDGKNPSTADGFLWVVSEGDKRISEMRLGPAALRLWAGMHGAAAALALAGNDVIIDDVIFDPRVLKEAVDTLHTFNALFVGVRCPLEIAEQRERERSNRNLGLAKAFYDYVHSHGIYDLEVDTSTLTSMECANQIKERLQNGSAPDALKRLRNILKSG